MNKGSPSMDSILLKSYSERVDLITEAQIHQTKLCVEQDKRLDRLEKMVLGLEHLINQYQDAVVDALERINDRLDTLSVTIPPDSK